MNAKLQIVQLQCWRLHHARQARNVPRAPNVRPLFSSTPFPHKIPDQKAATHLARCRTKHSALELMRADVGSQVYDTFESEGKTIVSVWSTSRRRAVIKNKRLFSCVTRKIESCHKQAAPLSDALHTLAISRARCATRSLVVWLFYESQTFTTWKLLLPSSGIPSTYTY